MPDTIKDSLNPSKHAHTHTYTHTHIQTLKCTHTFTLQTCLGKVHKTFTGRSWLNLRKVILYLWQGKRNNNHYIVSQALFHYGTKACYQKSMIRRQQKKKQKGNA
jgi:hypothetical protein